MKLFFLYSNRLFFDYQIGYYMVLPKRLFVIDRLIFYRIHN
jgi:hypothetical protein